MRMRGLVMRMVGQRVQLAGGEEGWRRIIFRRRRIAQLSAQVAPWMKADFAHGRVC